eukprot:CAMPEP_0172922082 /NCGR_PEP_ID=MMETSP1075-20121228/207147_1 /TAXON_ID=2916 /ORGANISM="Ceratium fusus, Strain PA161109" /LENGTH=239 /DNA_ID=CAMNT_0013782341 /DNA_START=7 /DNA_END=723 /DNA_ORIENTATION=+
MNPANPDFYNRSNSSPALFNRCVIDWFGDWPDEALTQVALDFTKDLELDASAFTTQKGLEEPQARHERVAQTVVAFHKKVDDINVQLQRSAQKYNFITPRDFLDFINHFIGLVSEKRAELHEQQAHFDDGLQKLKETGQEVTELQAGLASKEVELTQKNNDASARFGQMTTGQREAEEKQKACTELKESLEVDSKVVAEKSAVIESELAEAQPALDAAKLAISGVTKKALDEVRKMPNP